jgi:hypothetical protein
MATSDKTVIVDADQYALLKPYLKSKGVSLESLVREALLDHLNSTKSKKAS